MKQLLIFFGNTTLNVCFVWSSCLAAHFYCVYTPVTLTKKPVFLGASVYVRMYIKL